jgi:hypothetical protein
MARFPTHKAGGKPPEGHDQLLKRRELLRMRGKVHWEGDLRALRATRLHRDPDGKIEREEDSGA